MPVILIAVPPWPTVIVVLLETLLGLASALVAVAVTVCDPEVLPVAVAVNDALWPAARAPTVKETGLVGVRPAGSVSRTVALPAGRALLLVLVTLTVKLSLPPWEIVPEAAERETAREASWNSKAPTSGNSPLPASGR